MKRLLIVIFVLAGGLLFGAIAANSDLSASSQKISPPGAPATIEPDGTLDSTFDAGNFTNGQVLASALQPDGKVLIGGPFAKVHGQARLGLARLNADGTLDATFVPPAGFPLSAQQIVPQPDGKVIVVGSLTGSNLFRLNSDGSMDNGFTVSIDGFRDTSSGTLLADPSVRTALLQADGKIIVLGSFASVKNAGGMNVARSCIARLNSDGSLDETYNPGNGFQFGYNGLPSVFNAVQQTIGANAGKIVAEGDFANFNGSAAHGLARLNADGSFDSSFNFGSGSSFPAFEFVGVSRQADDSILVFGTFTSFSGAPSNGLVRLSGTSGAVDTGFNPPVFADYQFGGTAAIVAQQANGKLIVGGLFHFVGGVAVNNIVRLETDGSWDTTFSAVAAGPNASSVNTVLVDPTSGKIFVGGYFSSYDGVARNNFAWVNSDGSVDNTFDGLAGAMDNAPEVYAVAVQPDGKILVGGIFSSVNGSPHYNLVRLNADSTIDPTFDPNFGTKGSVRAILLQPDGKIVIAGNLEAVNGVRRGRIARLNADGALDTSFEPGIGANNLIYALSQDAAGNIYAGGAFTFYDDGFQSYITKLNPSGVSDSNFSSRLVLNGTVYAISPVDTAGRIVIGGTFSTRNVNGGVKRGLARIDLQTGAFDTSFNSTGVGTVSGPVRTLQVAPDGSFYISGLFTKYNNVDRARIARVNSDGSLDNGYVAPTTNLVHLASAFQNGKFLVAGIGSSAQASVVRLTNTGGLDSSFSIGSDFQVSPTTAYWSNYPEITALTVQPDGKLIIGGKFNNYNGSSRTALARLTGPNVTPSPTPTATATATPTATATATPTATATATPTATATTTPTATANATATATATPTATPGAVGNVSTRLPTGTGDNALFEGFIVQGPVGSTKKIIVRGIGPSLIPFGIGDALTNPTLEIHDSTGATVATNNDWKNTQIGGLITGDQSSEISGSGVAPSEDLESAIIVNLEPGSYTAVVRGAGNSTGTGVVDAYDLSGASPATLANIATRGLIQPGDKLMIAGFIVQNGPVQVVVNAIGPSLLAFGINNALPDTTLELRDQNGAMLLANDDWKTTQQQELEAVGLQPSHDLEAALLATIQPGLYTAQVRGKGDAAGIGVVQVFFLQ